MSSDTEISTEYKGKTYTGTYSIRDHLRRIIVDSQWGMKDAGYGNPTPALLESIARVTLYQIVLAADKRGELK